MTATSRWLFLVVMSAVLLAPRSALAGPPLLCHPFDIGGARSLPMGTGSWRAIDPSYDVSRLVDDTLALLTADAPILVHMETLRRATVYASTNPQVATALLEALQRRAGWPSVEAPLAVFDFGYLVETYRQAKSIFTAPVPAIDRINGYQLVLKAQAIRRDETMTRAVKLIAGESESR